MRFEARAYCHNCGYEFSEQQSGYQYDWQGKDPQVFYIKCENCEKETKVTAKEDLVFFSSEGRNNGKGEKK